MDNKDQIILIAEDEEINRTILREMLNSKYEVVEAENGHQAIYHIKALEDKISLIILDIHMPSLDGYGVMEYLVDNGLNEKIPVIITTSDQSSDVLLSAKKNKVADIVYKPFRASDIRKRVDNLVEICRYEQQLDSIITEKALYLTKEYEAMSKVKLFRKEKHGDKLKSLIDAMLPELSKHNTRIEEYMSVMCDALSERYPRYGIGKNEGKLISDASVLHDVGKLVISDDVYEQGEGASHRAYMQIRKRPIAAGELINMIYAKSERTSERKYAYDMCRYMYEQYDGKGFPDGLSGNEIPISAQILGLVHRYEDLRFATDGTERNPHRIAMRKILESEFKSYNPDLIDLFEDNDSEFEAISLKK